jgi:hypothetical protein
LPGVDSQNKEEKYDQERQNQTVNVFEAEEMDKDRKESEISQTDQESPDKYRVIAHTTLLPPAIPGLNR